MFCSTELTPAQLGTMIADYRDVLDLLAGRYILHESRSLHKIHPIELAYVRLCHNFSPKSKSARLAILDLEYQLSQTSRLADNAVCESIADGTAVRPCAGCSVPTYKTDGCSHMWCTVCRCSWDWDTGILFYNTMPNPHIFQHRPNDIGDGGDRDSTTTAPQAICKLDPIRQAFSDILQYNRDVVLQMCPVDRSRAMYMLKLQHAANIISVAQWRRRIAAGLRRDEYRETTRQIYQHYVRRLEQANTHDTNVLAAFANIRTAINARLADNAKKYRYACPLVGTTGTIPYIGK